MKTFEQNPPFVLFADDDEDTLNIFREFVELFGWTGDYVKTARDIISRVNENCSAGRRCYDALVCDVNYFDENPDAGPRISGVAAAREIRKTHPDLPIVFVSGYSTVFINDEVKRVGSEMFVKPVDYEAVFSRISYLIRWHRMMQPQDIELAEDRRRASINRSGYNRRRTDVVIEVPKILETLNLEVREERLLTAKKHGH